MHHRSEYSSYYPSLTYNPNPNPTPNSNSAPTHPSFASAPPFSNYPSDPQPYNPTSPTAPSYSDPYQNATSSYPQLNPQQNYSLDYSQQNPQPNYPHLQQTYYPYDPTPQSDRYPPNPNHNSSYPAPYDANYPGSALSTDNSGAGYGGYLNNRSGFERDFMDGGSGGGIRFDRLSLGDNLINEGAYAYDGGRSEPYGARGTVPTRSPALFDDYGRSISLPSSGKGGGGSGAKIVRAVPKAETQQDVKNGVMKYRVKLLSEGGDGTQDVLCQIGLDGIRMLDPSTSRTLRIYPLENLTRWEVADSSTFSFWSKSSVDIEPRRIRLQSNSYTTNTILDTVTAATVQLKEMGGKDSLIRGKGAADTSKQSEQTAEKKKGLLDWMAAMKPVNEEKDHWVPDDAVNKCTACGSDFGAFNRRHHCRNCGDIFCDKCTQGRIALTNDENAQPVRVCDKCMAEVSQRLNNAKEAVNRPAVLHSHEDLARKLQEEMEKNRKSGSKSSDSSGRRVREVACPICTVHLQVQVPTSGSETIECGVCQHPFLVSSH